MYWCEKIWMACKVFLKILEETQHFFSGVVRVDTYICAHIYYLQHVCFNLRVMLQEFTKGRAKKKYIYIHNHKHKDK